MKPSRHFTRDELVIRLIEQGVPRWKAERAADAQVVQGLALPRPKPRARVKKSSGLTPEQRIFRVYCKDNGLPMPLCDYRFATERGSNMELDYAWPDEKVALEIQGGIFRAGGGAHQGRGHLRDMKKLNLAQELGWTVVQCVPDDTHNPLILEQIRNALSRAALTTETAA